MGVEDPDAEIWAAIRTIFESFAARDESAIENQLHQACTVWDVFEPELIEGREQRRAFHQRDRSQSESRGPLTWELIPLRMDRYRDLAVARYYLDFDYQPPNATAGRVRITDVLRQVDGRWVVVHHHEGLSPSGPPATGT